MKKPLLLILILFLLIMESIGAIGGGICLIIKPNGDILQMPTTPLAGSIFKDYLIPGIILFLFNGIYPLLISFYIIKKKELFKQLNLYKELDPTYSHLIYFCIILILWINFEIMTIGYGAAIQLAYSFLGIFLLCLSLLPSIRNYFKKV